MALPDHPGTETGPAPAAGRSDWYWAIPELAVMFFVLAIVAFLWVVERQEREQSRQALIGDILWLEQNIRFHIQGIEDMLALLAREAAEGLVDEEGFRLRAAILLNNSPELTRIALVDSAGLLGPVLPGEGDPWRRGATIPDGGIRAALQLATGGGRRVYDLLPAPRGEPAFVVVVPGGDGRVAAVVGVYSLTRVVGNLVPWWFAQKYHVTVLDSAGEPITTKSGVEPVAAELSYQLPLDPPGHGLVLRATAYATPAGPGERLFTWVVFGLTGVILWSLWMMRRHVLRRELAETALRASHERFMTVLEGLDAAVAVRDPQTRESLYCNGRFRELFGPARADGAYCPLVPWRPATDLAGEPLDIDVRDPASGRWFHLRRQPLRWVDERTVQLEAATDISARKAAEELSRQHMERLQVTSRLVTMGEMASALAHELNQPLSAIASYNTGCLNMLRSGQADPTALLAAVEKIGTQAQRAGRVLKGIQTFVRKRQPQLGRCDLNAAVAEALGFLQPETRARGVHLIQRLDPDLPPVHADRVMLEQVVLNLARNAVEAMAGCQRRVLTVATCRDGDGQARVAVADTGPGLPPELQAQPFAPFFTTKPEGMGMGLSICRSIVEFHQGRLGIEANPGGGSLFTISLPI